VPQDPSDEPASVLLARIEDEKARLAKEGKIRKPKTLPLVSEDEMPFEAPRGWAWSRLGVLATLIVDGSHNPPRNVGETGIPMLSGQNVRDGSITLAASRYISEADFAAETKRYDIRANDVLICIVGSIGRSAVVPHGFPRAALQRSAALVRVPQLSPEYVSISIRSPTGQSYLFAHAKGTAQLGVYLGVLAKMPLALPPVAEQHRIVAKVDELMGLLDRLEAARTTRETTRAALRDAALAALRDADTAEEVEAAWARIADRMDDLFTDPADVDPLRQTVLELAVRGHLVPQDPSEEPAGALLERIEDEKARLAKEGKIRKPKTLPLVSEDDAPFEVPSSWSMIRFGEAFTTLMTGPFGTSLKKSEYIEGGTPVINPQNLRNGLIVPTGATCVGPATLERLAVFKVKSRDIVVARRGEMGRCAVVQDSQDGWLCGTGSLVLRPPSELDVHFVALFLGAPSTVIRLSGDSVGATMRNLNQRIMLNLPFGLPPLAEQHRIVAKVDDLMDLLDRLEQRLNRKTSAHDAFAAAAVHHFDS